MLSWLAVHVERSDIENDLERRSRAALAASGHTWASIAFDGRDGLLVGQPASAQQQAEAVELVRGVWGVRAVEARSATVTIADLPIRPVAEAGAPPTVVEETPPAAIGDLAPGIPARSHTGQAVLLAAAAPPVSVRAHDREPDAVVPPVRKGLVPAPSLAPIAEVETGSPAGMTTAEHTARVQSAEPPGAVLASAPEAAPSNPEPSQPAAEPPSRTDAAQGRAMPPTPAPRFETAALPPGNIPSTLDCAAAAETAAQGLQLHFARGAASLDKPGKALIDGLIVALNACPAVALRVAGHADTSGKARYNKALSKRRARAVAAYLINKGIDAGRIVAIGYGDEQPVAPNDTQANRAKNRRIEVSVTARRAPLPPMPVRKQGTRNGLSHR